MATLERMNADLSTLALDNRLDPQVLQAVSENINETTIAQIATQLQSTYNYAEAVYQSQSLTNLNEKKIAKVNQKIAHILNNVDSLQLKQHSSTAPIYANLEKIFISINDAKESIGEIRKTTLSNYFSQLTDIEADLAATEPLIKEYRNRFCLDTAKNLAQFNLSVREDQTKLSLISSSIKDAIWIPANKREELNLKIEALNTKASELSDKSTLRKLSDHKSVLLKASVGGSDEKVHILAHNIFENILLSNKDSMQIGNVKPSRYINFFQNSNN